MKLLFRLAMLVIALVLVLFALSNRSTVPLGLWPLPNVIELPLYLIILGCLVVGFVAGELTAWIAGRHWRREARQSARRIAVLESELAEARELRLLPPSDIPPPARLAG